MKTKLCRPILIDIANIKQDFSKDEYRTYLSLFESKHPNGKNYLSLAWQFNYTDKINPKQLVLISFDKDNINKVIATQNQLSPEYIQQFIKEYNNDTVKDIEILMEESCCDNKVNGGINSPDCCHKHIIQPKLTNGFITIINYPIGGYAPGNYTCNCVTCKKQFIGDKRAVQCKDCATKVEEYIIGKPLDDYTKDKHTQEECTGFIHGYKSRMKEEVEELCDLAMVYLYNKLTPPHELIDDWFNNNKKK